MLRKGYGKFIIEYVNNESFNKPIYTDAVAEAVAMEFDIDLGKAKTITNVNLKRIVDNGRLERFHKGIYYQAKETLFGKKRLNADAVAIDMFVKKGERIIGYETGPSLFNKIGLTTQIPKNYYIATNLYTKRLNYGRNVVIKKPVTEIENSNVKYLQALDVIANLDKIPIDTEEPIKIVRDFISQSGIENNKMILMARKFYGENVLVSTVDIILGGL